MRIGNTVRCFYKPLWICATLTARAMGFALKYRESSGINIDMQFNFTTCNLIMIRDLRVIDTHVKEFEGSQDTAVVSPLFPQGFGKPIKSSNTRLTSLTPHTHTPSPKSDWLVLYIQVPLLLFIIITTLNTPPPFLPQFFLLTPSLFTPIIMQCKIVRLQASPSNTIRDLEATSNAIHHHPSKSQAKRL